MCDFHSLCSAPNLNNYRLAYTLVSLLCYSDNKIETGVTHFCAVFTRYIQAEYYPGRVSTAAKYEEQQKHSHVVVCIMVLMCVFKSPVLC